MELTQGSWPSAFQGMGKALILQEVSLDGCFTTSDAQEFHKIVTIGTDLIDHRPS